MALQREAGNRTSGANAWDSLGYVHLQRKVFHEAIDCYLQPLTLHREDGNRFDEAQAWVSISEVHVANGDAENAVTAMRSGLAILQDIDPVAAAEIRERIQQLAGDPADGSGALPSTMTTLH